jgi:hypothetical protein
VKKETVHDPAFYARLYKHIEDLIAKRPKH